VQERVGGLVAMVALFTLATPTAGQARVARRTHVANKGALDLVAAGVGLDSLQVQVAQNSGVVRLTPEGTKFLWPEGEPVALQAIACVRGESLVGDDEDLAWLPPEVVRRRAAAEGRNRHEGGPASVCVETAPVPNTVAFSLGPPTGDAVIERLTAFSRSFELHAQAIRLQVGFSGRALARLPWILEDVEADTSGQADISFTAQQGEIAVGSLAVTFDRYEETGHTLGTALASPGLVETLMEVGGTYALNALLARSEVRETVRSAFARLATSAVNPIPGRVVPGTFRFSPEGLLFDVIEQVAPPAAPRSCQITQACVRYVRVRCAAAADLLRLEVASGSVWRPVGSPSSSGSLADEPLGPGRRRYRVCAADPFSKACSGTLLAQVQECGLCRTDPRGETVCPD
jgi:hypothetical protein